MGENSSKCRKCNLDHTINSLTTCDFDDLAFLDRQYFKVLHGATYTLTLAHVTGMVY